MENWRQYMQEVRFVDPPTGKPVIDITGKGSNELGDPHETGSIAYKIANDLATPCTSSADCAEKKKAVDGPTEDWSTEEYGEWYQENEEAVNKANFDVNQFLAVKKHAPNRQDAKWESFFDQQLEIVNSADNQKQADDALRQIQMLLDRQADMSASKSSWSTPEEQDQWLWDNRWPPEND